MSGHHHHHRLVITMIITGRGPSRAELHFRAVSPPFSAALGDQQGGGKDVVSNIDYFLSIRQTISNLQTVEFYFKSYQIIFLPGIRFYVCRG